MLLKKSKVYVFPRLVHVLQHVLVNTYCQENKNITFVVVFFFICKSFLYHNNSLFLKEMNETANFLTVNFLIL